VQSGNVHGKAGLLSAALVLSGTVQMQELHLQIYLIKARTAKHRVGDCGQSHS